MRTLADPATRDAITRRVDRLTPVSTAQWGGMTSTQMLRHLVIAFRMALDEYPVAEAPSRKFDTPLVRFAALTLPVPWPRGIKTLPEIDCVALQPSPAEFVQDRADLMIFIRRFGDVSASSLRSTHPMLGSLTRVQWMRWGFRHTDHHLRQFGC